MTIFLADLYLQCKCLVKTLLNTFESPHIIKNKKTTIDENKSGKTLFHEDIFGMGGTANTKKIKIGLFFLTYIVIPKKNI